MERSTIDLINDKVLGAGWQANRLGKKSFVYNATQWMMIIVFLIVIGLVGFLVYKNKLNEKDYAKPLKN